MGGLGDLLLYLLVRGLVGLVGLLPLTWAYALCGRLGRWAVHWTPRHRAVGLRNLDLAFPERSREWKLEIFRSSYERLGHLLVEISRLHKLNARRASTRVDYEPERGLQNYHRARAQGKGVLFVTAHISAWELLPAAHALLGHPLNFVVRPLDNPFLEAWAERIRERFGNRTLSKTRVLRNVLRSLERSEDVGFLLDQNVQEKEAIFVPFFGRPAATTPAVASLALKTGAPIVAGFIYPLDRRGRYRIRFYTPIQADRESTPVEITARLNRLIEEVIREHPDCWLWGHRRFHTQPDGSDLYQI